MQLILPIRLWLWSLWCKESLDFIPLVFLWGPDYHRGPPFWLISPLQQEDGWISSYPSRLQGTLCSLGIYVPAPKQKLHRQLSTQRYRSPYFYQQRPCEPPCKQQKVQRSRFAGPLTQTSTAQAQPQAKKIFWHKLENRQPLSLASWDSSTSFGGHLTLFFHTWSAITTDKWVLNIIFQGYTIEFIMLSPPRPPTLFPFRDHSYDSILAQAVFLITTSSNRKHSSTISRNRFLFNLPPNTQGGWRPIRDFRHLSHFIRKSSSRKRLH